MQALNAEAAAKADPLMIKFLKTRPVMVEIAHLASYKGMGTADVSCSGDCMCGATVLNGNFSAPVSLTTLHDVLVTQGDKCDITVTVRKETHDAGGAHKVMGKGKAQQRAPSVGELRA